MTASAIPYFSNDADETLSFVRAHKGVTTSAASTDHSDEALLLNLKQKDMAALGVLYERYARLVFNVCMRILKDQSEAQDLVHDVFLCLYKQASLFDASKGAGRSWLLQVTYHRCFDRRKHLKARHGFGAERTGVIIKPIFQGRVPDFASQIIWNPRMVEAFDRLTKEQQTSLQLYYLHGLSFQEIANLMGCAKGNVKNYVYRGLAHLREIIFSQRNANIPAAHIKAASVARFKLSKA